MSGSDPASPDANDPRDDYLYDKSGTPDPDVVRLERALRPLGTSDDAVVPAMTTASRRRVPLRVWAAAAAVFVGLFLASAVIWNAFVAPGFNAKYVVVRLGTQGPVDPATVNPSAVAGTGGPGPVRDSADSTPFREGAWIETADEHRELTIGGALGRITLGAQSSLQVRRVGADVTRLFLARGSLEAFVSADAKPRFFQVDTDAARCVDLGCRYTLDVTKDGVATVRVTTGQVAFETETREVYVPAGAVCVARVGRGPGTPRFEDAPDAVRAAFDAYDAAPIASAASPKTRAALAALDTVRDARDTLPAWHLLQDPDPSVVTAAAARLELIAGACTAPESPSPADLRAAWKAHLEPGW